MIGLSDRGKTTRFTVRIETTSFMGTLNLVMTQASVPSGMTLSLAERAEMLFLVA
jgi:hypothetical protein